MIEITSPTSKRKMPNIFVVGIGGGGNNAVDRMIESGFENVSFISVNTDYDVLSDCKAEITLQIGAKTTGGFGAGTDPLVGEAAARESEDDIRSALSEANMVILTCGLGGGTGTGAIPVIAGICKDMGILTLAVVTLPFSFEGTPRAQVAQRGLDVLKSQVDTLLVIPNDKLLHVTDKQFLLDDAFLMADNVLKYTIEGITNIIFNRGVINLDFNDLNKLFRNKGLAHLGIGMVREGGSIIEAVKQAIESQLLETTIQGATTILLNTSGRINLNELNEAVSYVRDLAGQGTDIIWGTVTDKSKADENNVVVTLIATGLPEDSHETSYEVKDPPRRFMAELTAGYKSGYSAAPVYKPESDEPAPEVQTFVKHSTDNIPLNIPSFLLNRQDKKMRKNT